MIKRVISIALGIISLTIITLMLTSETVSKYYISTVTYDNSRWYIALYTAILIAMFIWCGYCIIKEIKDNNVRGMIIHGIPMFTTAVLTTIMTSQTATAIEVMYNV